VTSRSFATVAGRAIPLARLDARIEALRRGPRGRHLPPGDGPATATARRWVARELVTEAVIAHEMRSAGVTAPHELVRVATAGVTVAEADARDYYRRNPDRFARPEARVVRHVVLADEPTALATAALPARLDDGPLVTVRRGELAGALEDALFAAAPGAIVGPIRTELGWHVARLETVVPATVAPFDEVRPTIEADLLEDARRRAFDRWLEDRRARLAVMDPAYEHPGHPVHGFASHRH